MPVPECPTIDNTKTRVTTARCLPQNEDCKERPQWLRRIDSDYTCPFDKPPPIIPEPPLRVPDSDCPPGPYRDPVEIICPTFCECIPDIPIDDSWRGDPKDFCFAYKNRYRNLRNPKTNKRCVILIKRQQALLQAMREQAEKDMAKCRAATKKKSDVPRMDCKSLFYADYTFTKCFCEECKIKERWANYIASLKLGCGNAKPKIVHTQLEGCGPQRTFQCNSYYNPRKKDRCACKCGCLEGIQKLYDMQNIKRK